MVTVLTPPERVQPQPHPAAGSAIGRVREIIEIEQAGLDALKNQLNDDVDIALALMSGCEGRVVITGMGKSGLIGKKIAATLSSTGTPAIFLHPAEGSHGDLGTLTRNDVVIAISNSGETPEILAVLPLIKRFGLPLIAMTGKVESTLAQTSNAVLNIAVPQEACPLGLAPTASTTATLAMGDALAVVLLERKGFTSEDFAMFHPAGSLGKRLLLRVQDVMRKGEALPKISLEASFVDVLSEINAKTLGLTLVMKGDATLAGIITDGDIRRGLSEQPDTSQLNTLNLMSTQPKTITPDALAVEALRLMETHKITALVVAQLPQPETPSQAIQPLGIIHLHDLFREGLA